MHIRNLIWPSLVVLSGLALLPITTQADTINGRRADQHSRIHQGVASGQLTRREAHALRHRERSIHSREVRDRMAHGGHLTARERYRLNHSLNRTSRAIYRDKHNDQVR